MRVGYAYLLAFTPTTNVEPAKGSPMTTGARTARKPTNETESQQGKSRESQTFQSETQAKTKLHTTSLTRFLCHADCLATEMSRVRLRGSYSLPPTERNHHVVSIIAVLVSILTMFVHPFARNALWNPQKYRFSIVTNRQQSRATLWFMTRYVARHLFFKAHFQNTRIE